MGPLSLGLIGLLAFGLRSAYILSAWSHPALRIPVIDAEAYRARAMEILAGDWLGQGVYYLDPLYPFFLAAVYSVMPPESIGVLLTQAALDSVSVLVLVLIGRHVFGEPAALVAGLIAATYKPFFFYSALLLKAPVMIFLMVAALYTIVRAADQERAWAWFPAGYLLGLAALTRGNSLLFAPTLAIWLLALGSGASTARVRASGVLFLGLACAIGPVSLRNFVVGDDLVLLNSQAGQNFYIGHFEGNDSGVYRAPPFLRPNPAFEEDDFAREARRLTGRDMKPSEISSFWLDEGLGAIAADPGRFLRHSFKKTLVLFNRYEVPDNASYAYFEREVSRMLAWPLPSYGLVLPIAVAGLVLSWRRPLAQVLALFVFSYSAGILLFFNLSRLRLPIVPVLILFAGFALVEGVDRLRRRDWRGLWIPVGVALLLVPVTRLEQVQQSLNVRYVNMGIGFLERSEAEWTAAEALGEDGDGAAASRHHEAALSYRDFADEQFRRALEEDPGYPRAARALRNSMVTRVLQLTRLGQQEAAGQAAQTLVERYPAFASGHVILGRAHVRAGQRGQAREAFLRALAIDPRDAGARSGLRRLAEQAGASGGQGVRERGRADPAP